MFGVGHDRYWSQFDGLLDQLRSKLRRFITDALDVDRILRHLLNISRPPSGLDVTALQ